SAISAEVIIGTVVIVFAIGLVVLLLVADEIIECEAVMHGHVVNAAVQPAAIVLELRGRSGHTVRQIADEGSLAAPEAANGLAVEIVPLRPSGRERADLIAAGTDVPWLGDQFNVAEHRILPHGGKKWRVGSEGGAAPKRRRKIETESVDVEDRHPQTKRIHHHLQHARMRKLQRIACTGEVLV